MRTKFVYIFGVLILGLLVLGCASQKDYSEPVKPIDEVPEVESSASMPPVAQQPKKVMPPSFESKSAVDVVSLVEGSAVEKKVNKTVVPLSLVPKVATNGVPVEVECVGPSDNNIYVRETVVRTYQDGSLKEFVDTCKGTDYLYIVQCSKVLKARSVSCKQVGASCVEGACVKK